MSQSIVTAVFDTHREADRALSELRQAGMRASALSIIAQHDGKTTTTTGEGDTEEHGGSILRGILGGGALGAGLGVAALAIPGVGPLAAAGAIAASVVPEAIGIGAALGAAAGSLNEVLKKHGVSDEDAAYYNERIKTGGVFISVDTSDTGIDRETAERILYSSGGHSSTRARNASDTWGDKVAGAFDGRDDPNRGPVDRFENVLEGTDDPNRGPLDRAENAFKRNT